MGFFQTVANKLGFGQPAIKDYTSNTVGGQKVKALNNQMGVQANTPKPANAPLPTLASNQVKPFDTSKFKDQVIGQTIPPNAVAPKGTKIVPPTPDMTNPQFRVPQVSIPDSKKTFKEAMTDGTRDLGTAPNPIVQTGTAPQAYWGTKAGENPVYANPGQTDPKSYIGKPVTPATTPTTATPVTPIQPTTTPMTTPTTGVGTTGGTTGTTSDWTQYSTAKNEATTTPTSTTTPTTTSRNTTTPTTSASNTSRQGLLETTVGMGTKTPDSINQANTLLAQRQDEYNSLIKEKGDALGKLELEPMTIGMKSGISQQIQDNYNARIEAAGNALNQASTQLQAANTTFGTQSGLIQGALGETAPIQVPYSNQLINPITGQGAYGAGTGAESPKLQSAVAQAVKLAQTVGPNDPNVQALLTPLGLPGQALFTSMMSGGGNYNPAAMNAQSQYNLGIGSEYSGQSAQLGTVLNQFKGVQNAANSFLQSTGLNQEGSPFYNQQINTYKAQLKQPAQIAAYNDIINNIKTYSAQILGSSGLNPTDIGEMVSKIDPEGMTGPQLMEFLNYIDYLGNIRKSELDATAKGGWTGGTNAFTSTPANTSSAPTFSSGTGYTGAPNAPITQGLLGTAMNFGGTITAAGSAILKFLGI